MTTQLYRSITLALVWTLMLTSAVPLTGAAPLPAPSTDALRAAPSWSASPEQPAAPLLLSGGSTISGTLGSSDTWGPGVITVTGDITITAGTVITIVSGTEVQMATADGLSSGLDPTRIEWIVSGTLRVNGPVTFTSQSGTPSAGGDWYGIRFLPGSGGWLDHALVEYGVAGVSIDGASPSLTYNTIRYMRGDDGISGFNAPPGSGFPGGNGTPGGPAYGIIITGTSALPIQYNTVYSITGGAGGNGGDGDNGTPLRPAGSNSGSPGDGGAAYGIVDWGHTQAFTYTGNVIYEVRAGRGGKGGDGGNALFGALGAPGGPGANGGNGGSAYGLYIASSPTTTVMSQVVMTVTAGAGGGAGDSGWTEGGPNFPGGPGGAGGNAWGVRVDGTAFVHNGSVTAVVGGRGGHGGKGSDVAAEFMNAGGGPGGGGGTGGSSTGIEVQGDRSLVDPTSVSIVRGGSGGVGGDGGKDDERVGAMAGPPTGSVLGGQGGPGGAGGDARGLYNNGGARVQFQVVTATQVVGGAAGAGGAGGAAFGRPSGLSGFASGGMGGNGGGGGGAYGLHTDGLTPTVQLLIAEEIEGGAGGGGGQGGNAQDEVLIQAVPPAGMGGTGGAGGNSYGLRNESSGDGGRMTQNEIALVAGGQGGAGGRGGDGNETFPFGAALVFGGNGGLSGNGGSAWGLLNLSIADTLVTRTIAYSITAGGADTGGNGGDISYLTPPPGPPLRLPGNGGAGGTGGAAAGVDSNARLENNLAYAITGGAGGNGGSSGMDWFLTGQTASGGNGGNGGDGYSLGAADYTPVLHNTGAKTQGGAPGANGFPDPGTAVSAGDGLGAWILAGGTPIAVNGVANNIFFSHTLGVRATGPITLYNNLISATVTSQGPVNWAGGNITGTAAADPFVNFTGDDYHLSGCGSVAAEAGTVVDVYDDGADGDPRPWGFFDIGYDEYLPAWLSPTAVSGVIAVDTTWTAGHYLLMGDVLIKPGVVLTVSPGALVQVNPLDLWNLGVDANRIEVMVRGTLRSGVVGTTPVTFTVAGCNPAPGQWYGIQFQPGSRGYLDPTIVEYGVHGVVISTTNPITIADSIIRYNQDAPPGGDAWGAGVAIFTGTHYVADTLIYNNSLRAGARAMGAGVYLVGGSTLFEESTVRDNLAESTGGDGFGGGLVLWGGGAPTLRHCEVYSNSVRGSGRAFGGGVDIDNTDAVMEADTFIHNNSILADNGNAYGGGVSIGAYERVPTPIIRNSRVTTNTCRTVGQLLSQRYCYGGGVGFFDGSPTRAVISDSLIAANVSRGVGVFSTYACGGGIGVADGATADRFDGNIVRDNQAVSRNGWAGGGGVCLAYLAAVSVTNDLVFNNTATDLVGASGNGGGIFANGPDAVLVNNTVVSNTALWNGGGVYLVMGILSNTIVVSNTAGLDGGGVFWGGGSAGYNDVWGNTCSGPGCGADYDSFSVRPATDINTDPLFVGAGGLATFYHLRQGSPAVNAGTDVGLVPNQDYDDQARPLGSHRDMGFDEVQPFAYTKQVNVSTATIGGSLVYTIRITNPDSIAPLAGGWLTDVLPLNTTYASGPSCNLVTSGYSSGSRTAWWNGNVPASTTLTCVYTTTVNRSLADGTTITNTAFFTAGVQGGWTNQVNTTVYAPVFTITKQTSGNMVVGAPLTYTLTVTNTGQGGGTSVVVTDAVPVDAHYVSGGSFSSGVVSWTVSSIAAGGSAQVSFAVTTCQSSLVNRWYRVVTSTQGIVSNWGVSRTTSLVAPTLTPTFTQSSGPVAAGTVTFTDNSTFSGSPIVAWSWDLGDNTTASGAQVAHTYSSVGAYTVTLTITDGCGYPATIIVPNAVTITCAGVTADYSWAPTPVPVRTPITFTVALTAGTPPITYTWGWGDIPTPTVTTLTSTLHTFVITGSVPVTLTAQNACFNNIVAVNNVAVEPRRIYLPVVLRQ